MIQPYSVQQWGTYLSPGPIIVRPEYTAGEVPRFVALLDYLPGLHEAGAITVHELLRNLHNWIGDIETHDNAYQHASLSNKEKLLASIQIQIARNPVSTTKALLSYYEELTRKRIWS